MRHSLALLLALCFALAGTSAHSQEGQPSEDSTYSAKAGKITLEFKVKRGEAADSIFGIFNYPDGGEVENSLVRGTYEEFTNVVVIFTRDSFGRTVLRGTYNAELDRFELVYKPKKKKSILLRASSKGNVTTPLTGTWQINDQSISVVDLEESRTGGQITGALRLGFVGYIATGVHTDDSDIKIDILSPERDDDVSYTLRLCASGRTMVGFTDSTFSSNDTVWCRKKKGSRDDHSLCPDDPSC